MYCRYIYIYIYIYVPTEQYKRYISRYCTCAIQIYQLQYLKGWQNWVLKLCRNPRTNLQRIATSTVHSISNTLSFIKNATKQTQNSQNWLNLRTVAPHNNMHTANAKQTKVNFQILPSETFIIIKFLTLQKECNHQGIYCDFNNFLCQSSNENLYYQNG